MARRLPAAPSWTKLGSVATLRAPSFPYLLLDNAFAMVGFHLRTMAQAWLVLKMTDSDAWVGLANGLPAIPVAILALFGGVLADRADRRTLLIWTRLSFAGCGVAAAVLISAGVIELPYVVVLAFVVAAATSFGVTVSQTLVVDIVGRDRLFSANAFFGTAMTVSAVVGPVLGGVLIARFGVDAAFYAVAVLLAVAAAFASLVRVERPAQRAVDTSVMYDLREGLRYVMATPALRWLLLLGFLLVFAGMYMPLVPRYARDVLGAGPEGYGTLLAAMGVGGLVGSATLIAAGNVRSLALVLAGSAVLFLVLMVVFAFSTTLPLSAAVSFGFGVLIVWWSTAVRTAFQITAADEMRGRVMGLLALNVQMLTLAWLVGGVGSELIGPRATMILGAAVTAFFYVLAYALSPDLRRVGKAGSSSSAG